MGILKRVAGRGPEILPQPLSERLIDHQRFGDVAMLGERLHQDGDSTLTQRRGRDDHPRGALRSGELGTAKAQAGGRVALKRPNEDVVEFASPLVDPRRLVLAEQRALRDKLRTQ